MTFFLHPHGGEPGDEHDGPPGGEHPRKLRLIPIRPVLGDAPVRLSFGRVRRFAPAWTVRFFPQWPSRLVRRWWLAVAAGLCAASLVLSAARSLAAHAPPLDTPIVAWRAAPARRPLRSVLAVMDWLDVVPVSIAGAVAFAAFCWRTRRDRLGVAVSLAVAAMLLCYTGVHLLLAPVHAAMTGRVGGADWTASGRALAAMAVGWTVAFVLLRQEAASWPGALASLGWPIAAGVLRVVGGGALPSSVLVGWTAGIAMAGCAAALWLVDRRKGTRLA